MKATKAGLVKHLQRETACTKPVAAAYADCMVAWLAGAISEYETIELRGLGVFDVTRKNEHRSRFDPDKTVPAQKKVKFRPGRALQEALKNTTKPEDARHD
ncbi:MAG: HU family DNA-binding protein [Treponema sp.]|jgi:nucleoid DNA-binding protein|nr:HU family DNA-binding protein [Treponema sp.]